MNSLEAFFSQVGKRSLLTASEEVSLSQRIENGDQSARAHMIEANLRLAISIAKQYSKTGCNLEDLIQESSVGLIKAVDRFDWRRGYKFSTYACWWIRQSVRKHVANQSGSIKLPTHARGLLWRMENMKKEYVEEFGIEPTIDELSELLGVRVDTLNSLVTSAKSTLSLDDVSSRGDDEGRRLYEVIPDEDCDIEGDLERKDLNQVIRAALLTLTPREEKVLRLRFGLTEESTNHTDFPITESEIAILDARAGGN
jgi:RNA polymerase primary sigma factor